jgi:hypothetical protein
MTLRTYRYFICFNGHLGVEKTSENDQPYSTPWENITTTGLSSLKKGKQSSSHRCTVCGSGMVETEQPK